MPLATRTLPAANSVPAGQRTRVLNSRWDTTLRVVPTGADYIGAVGNLQWDVNPIEAVEFESNGVDGWWLAGNFGTALIDGYDGAPLIDITGTTQVVLSRSPTQPVAQSPYFTVSAGNLVATRPCFVMFDISFVWTPTIANNQDAGIIFNLVLRSGTGSLGVDLYGNLFQSSRANTVAFGDSHQFGFGDLQEGDVVGIDASDYTGQTGVSDLDDFSLYCESWR